MPCMWKRLAGRPTGDPRLVQAQVHPPARAVRSRPFVSAGPFCRVSFAVVPSDVRPSGTLITVHGKRLTPQARMFVAGYVLADPATYPFELSSRRRAPKRWLWALNTALERVQPISVADLARTGVVYTGDNASFDDLRYNKTLCSIMAEHGLLKSTASFAAEVQDFDEAPNEELSDLLGFRWIMGAASPRDSAAASAQDFGAEAGIESTRGTFVMPCMPSSTAEVR